MGPYCNFCQRRCFVYPPPRLAPEHREKMMGRSLIFATCEEGKRFDKAQLGFDIDDLHAQDARLAAIAAGEL